MCYSHSDPVGGELLNHFVVQCVPNRLAYLQLDGGQEPQHMEVLEPKAHRI